MGKNQKHKKVLKSEKAKVKLKGKKLPKETNVTDTNFKIRKIVINKQLEENSENDLLTKRKLNLKDLLTRLRHYNVSSRTEALLGIKELITNYSVEILTKNLNDLLENVPRLALDSERSVRHECFKLLTLILNPVSTIKIAPFFELIISYLSCAMTHINQNIQEDSLIFIDILLNSTPSLLAKYYIKILPIFLNLISRIRSDSKVDRKLTLNLNSKQTSVKWRVKVLIRLLSLLKAIGNERVVKKVESNKIKFDRNGGNYFGVYNGNYLSNCTLNCLGNVGESMTEIHNLNQCIDSVMPILFESWLENKPNDDNYLYESLITDEAAEVLLTICEIIKILIKLIEMYEKTYNDKLLKKNFINKFETNYLKYFMEKFPYSKMESSVKIKTDTSILHDQNILLAYLFLEFRKNNSELDTTVFEYLKSCILIWNSLNKETSFLLLRNLQMCLQLKKTKYDIGSVLSFLVKYFLSHRHCIAVYLKDDIFRLLCDVLENDRYSGMEDYQMFLGVLPQILGKELITMAILNVVATLCRKNHEGVIRGIRKYLPDIVSNLERMQLGQHVDEIEDGGTPFEVLNHILYYVKRVPL